MLNPSAVLFIILTQCCCWMLYTYSRLNTSGVEWNIKSIINVCFFTLWLPIFFSLIHYSCLCTKQDQTRVLRNLVSTKSIHFIASASYAPTYVVGLLSQEGCIHIQLICCSYWILIRVAVVTSSRRVILFLNILINNHHLKYMQCRCSYLYKACCAVYMYNEPSIHSWICICCCFAKMAIASLVKYWARMPAETKAIIQRVACESAHCFPLPDQACYPMWR